MLAGLQLLGFLAGGVVVWVILRGHPVCGDCKRYLRTLTTSSKVFASQDGFAPYHDALFDLDITSPEFAQLAKETHQAKGKQGAVKLTMTLRGCPECKCQVFSKAVSVHNGRAWRQISSLRGAVALQPGANIVDSFRAA